MGVNLTGVNMNNCYELIIVGGGPAGLSSALIAGRARRSVLVIDGGTPRNAAAPAVHSYLSRDGISPRDFRAICHEELSRYPSVERCEDQVTNIRSADRGFSLDLASGRVVGGMRVVLALGLVDKLPAIAGVHDNWGKGVHACPYCDGFEHQDAAWGVLADQPGLLDHALFFRGWTGNLTVFTPVDGAPADKLAALEKAGIRIVTTPIAKVLGGNGHSLAGVELQDGVVLRIESLWVRPAQTQTPLPLRLSLRMRDDGAIWRDELGQTSLRGILAAGDCAAGPLQQAILAAADGARVTFPVINALVSS
jgi:thioredoxin reductase